MSELHKKETDKRQTLRSRSNRVYETRSDTILESLILAQDERWRRA